MDWKIDDHREGGDGLPVAEGFAVIAMGMALMGVTSSKNRRRQAFIVAREGLRHYLIPASELGPVRGTPVGTTKAPLLKAKTRINTTDMLPLGDGLHAPTYKGTHTDANGVHDVTIKMTQFSSCEPFESEVQCLAAAGGHRGVPEFKGICMHYPRDMVLVYEYAEGVPLHSVCKKRLGEGRHSSRPLPLTLQWRIAREIAEAMAHCHRKQVLHRDLKSMNVVVDISTPDGVERLNGIKLIDFGSAKLLDDRANDLKHKDDAWWELWGGLEEGTLMTRGVGTFDWVAPEVWSTRAVYSYPCDVYSFAMLLYEMATLSLPWTGGTAVHDDPSYFSSLKRDIIAGHRPTIPCSVHHFTSELIQRCWQTEPARRPTFHEILKLIDLAPWEEAHQRDSQEAGRGEPEAHQLRTIKVEGFKSVRSVLVGSA